MTKYKKNYSLLISASANFLIALYDSKKPLYTTAAENGFSWYHAKKAHESFVIENLIILNKQGKIYNVKFTEKGKRITELIRKLRNL